MKRIITFVLLLIFIFSLSSCKKKVSQPTLPPSQTMEFNDANFNNSQKVVGAGNWFTAAVTVGVWSAIVKVGFAIPIIAYKHALDQTPQRVDDNTWLWQYDVKIGFVDHHVKLYGSVDPNEDMVSWEMYVDDFNWFVGENNIEATQGYWIFYQNSDQPKEALKVEWTFNYSDSTGTAKYIVIDRDANNYNSYLSYGNTLTGLYNCFFEINNTADTSSVQIQWNDQTHIGRIKSEKYFGDQDWHCWDEQYQDCQCPSAQ